MDQYHPAEVARALVLYEHELGAKRRAETLFAGYDPDYVEEWTSRLTRGISSALAQMDQATTDRYVTQALGRCGERARSWWGR